MYRRISNKELADLPTDWENPTVDTRKYIQNVSAAYEVDDTTYLRRKRLGDLVQIHQGKYYAGTF